MARFIGGPCDGQNAGQALYSSTYCGGTKYTLAEDGNYHALESPGIGGAVPGQADVFRAWHKLTHSLGVRGPAAVRRSAAGRARLRRAVK